MVRGLSSKKQGEDNAEAIERRRLKRLAFEKNILSESPAKTLTPLSPSKQVIKHNGKDILRKSQRKNRFLLSFPGLLAPVTGGKIGEFGNLGSKNPILYLDFPQGRMKLFGTIVYPKNRYLTLQFSRAGKNVMCEDYFDNMIVFSDVWWIGRKDENPEEARLDFPKDMSEGPQMDYDFKGGAGVAGVLKTGAKNMDNQSPEAEFEDDWSDDRKKLNDKMEVTPVRQSERNAGKRFKFTEISSEEDPIGSDVDASESEEKLKHGTSTGNDGAGKSSHSCPVVLDNESEDLAEKQFSKQNHVSRTAATKTQKLSQSAAAENKEKSDGNNGLLVQATISTLFKKADKKVSRNSEKSSASGGSGRKLRLNDVGRKMNEAKGSRKKRKVTDEDSGRGTASRKKKCKVEGDEIEEPSSTSEDAEGSDEDWAA